MSQWNLTRRGADCLLRTLRTAALATALAGAAVSPAAGDGHDGAARVDLELVLAVDASSSVSTGEFELQMLGLAQAFRDPKVAAAIRASGDLGIAVALIQWSNSRKQSLAVDWAALRSAEDTVAFAEEVEAAPRFLIGGGTAIGGALQYAIRQLERNAFAGRRRVIDVSGDGRTNQGIQPQTVRDAAVAQGITINGLAILNEDLSVGRHYLAHVIGGTGAFVMTANDYEDYVAAILAKLIQEIAGVPIARRPGPPGEALAVASR